MLKPCRSCTFAVDTSARRCPHCGAKHPTVKGLAAPDGEAAVLTRRIDALKEQLEALAAVVGHMVTGIQPAPEAAFRGTDGRFLPGNRASPGRPR